MVVRRLQLHSATSGPGDAGEREADRVAEAVTQGTNAARSAPSIVAVPSAGLPITPHGAMCIDETVGRPGRPLDVGLRKQMEGAFERDFSHVRLHTDASADRSARAIAAVAYTSGHHIVFADGRFSPATADGRRLIAHELTHVVQQAGAASSVVPREPADDPDANVSLGSLDNAYVGKVAGEMVGPGHWAVLREFLRGLWGGLQAASPEHRARMDRKMQDFGLAAALKYVGGYALGVVDGLWTSIKGLAEAVVTLVVLPNRIGSYLGEHVPPLALKYGPRILEVMRERDGVAGRIRNVLAKLLASPGKSLRQLKALFDALGAIALVQVRKLGRGAAGEVMKVAELPWFEYGLAVGKITGQVLFEVILALASDAIANVVKEALSVAARLSARVVSGAVQLVKSAGRVVGEAIEWVGRLASKAGGEIGEMFEGLRALLNRIKGMLAELGEEAALTDAGGLRMPVPDSGAAALESRMVNPPVRSSPATVADLTPPKLDPSKVGAKTAGSTSEDIAAVMEDATGGTHRPQSIEADNPYRAADEGLPKETTDPTRRAEGDAARRSLRDATPPTPGAGWQKHHLVPWELRENPAVYEYERLVAKVDNPRAVENLGGRWMNQNPNNLTMPASKGLPGGEEMMIHRGSHPRYTSWMEGRLGQLWHEYRARPLSVEEFARRFEGIVGEAENALRTGVFGEKLR